MVSVSNNLALCSRVIDLRTVVEGVRVAERCSPAAQSAATVPLQRGGRRAGSGAQTALWKWGSWQELSGEYRDSGEEQHLKPTPLAQPCY